MAHRRLNRVFGKAQYRQGGQSDVPAVRGNTKVREKVSRETEDSITRIIKATEEKDYLKVLELPLPDVDELGHPVWPHCNLISKNYKRLCLLVHPDKNPGERAHQAFQNLTKVYKILLDEGQRSEVLKDACVQAIEEKEKREGRATVDEKIKLNSEKIQQKRKLSKIQHETFNSEILRQVRDRRQIQDLKRRKMANSKYVEKGKSNPIRGQEDQDQPDIDQTDERSKTDRGSAVNRPKIRKKPRFMF